MSKLQDKLLERWSEYESFFKQGSIYSAVVRLGEIENCVRHAEMPRGAVEKWRITVNQIYLSEENLERLQDEILRVIRQISRIVSVGSTFLYEELLLVTTRRVELELLEAFLAERGFADIFHAKHLASLDQEILSVAAIASNANILRNAQDAARKNWGVPLHSHWLSERIGN